MSIIIIITGGLVWDWINRKLYWNDISNKTIEVMDPETGFRKVLFQFDKNSANKLMNIIIDPLRRYVSAYIILSLLLSLKVWT